MFNSLSSPSGRILMLTRLFVHCMRQSMNDALSTKVKVKTTFKVHFFGSTPEFTENYHYRYFSAMLLMIFWVLYPIWWCSTIWLMGTSLRNLFLAQQGHLHTYRFCDNVWTFILENASFKTENELQSVDRVKIVACDAKILARWIIHDWSQFSSVLVIGVIMNILNRQL